MLSPNPTPHVAKVVAFPTQRLSDAELLEGLVRGESAFLGEIYKRFSPMVRRYLESNLGENGSSDDLVQEVFLSLWRTAPRIVGPGGLRAYLLGAAVRTTRMERRRLGRQRRWFGLWKEEQPIATSGTVAEERDLLVRLRALIDVLPEREREAFLLRYVEELPSEQVATALGVSLATAKRVVTRGRERLAKLVDREPGLREYLDRNKDELP